MMVLVAARGPPTDVKRAEVIYMTRPRPRQKAPLTALNGAPLDRLQDAGGWKSPNSTWLSPIPLRYVEAAPVANEGG